MSESEYQAENELSDEDYDVEEKPNLGRRVAIKNM